MAKIDLQGINKAAVTEALSSLKTSHGSATKSIQSSFTDLLTNSLKAVNQEQKVADKMATDLSTGKSENIHETMLALSKAELSFNLVVQVRNKVLEAYQDIMRMQV